MLLKLGGGDTKIELDSSIYVTMEQKILHELQSYVEHFKDEVSGCGLIEKISHKDDEGKFIATEYRITDVYLPEKQKNSAAATEIDADTVHDLVYELLQKGVDTSKLKLHWHSHADIKVFHSGTDEENYEDLNNGDFLISLVLNKDKDILASVHLYNGIVLDIDNVSVYVYADMNNKELDKKIKENIEKLDENLKKSTAISLCGNGYKDNYYGNDYEDIYNPKTGQWETKEVYGGVEKDWRDQTELAEEMFELCEGYVCHECPSSVACAKYYRDNYNCKDKHEYERSFGNY